MNDKEVVMVDPAVLLFVAYTFAYAPDIWEQLQEQLSRNDD